MRVKESAAVATGGQTVTLEIKGLRAICPDGKELFELDNVQTVEPNWAAITQTLIASGVIARRAHQYTEQFADDIFQEELAHTLAARSARVG